MSERGGLSKEALLRAFPVGLRQDATLAALGDVTAQALAARPAEIANLSIYARIMELPEELLDLLAYDYKVDWWDVNYSLEEKRRTLKDSWRVHKHLGTRYAVGTALGNILPGAVIQEWFEYGGKPYCFRIDVPVSEEGISVERQRRVLSRIWFYKNLRSHLDLMELHTETTGTLHIRAYGEAGVTIEVWPELKTAVTMPDAEVGMGVSVEGKEAVSVWPELAKSMEASAKVSVSGVMDQKNVTQVWPGVKEHVEKTVGAGGTWTGIHQIVEIYPEEE